MAFLKKCVYSLFSDYEITEKVFTVNMTFNFVRIIIENAKNQKKRGSLPNQKDALAVKKKEIHYGCS